MPTEDKLTILQSTPKRKVFVGTPRTEYSKRFTSLCSFFISVKLRMNNTILHICTREDDSGFWAKGTEMNGETASQVEWVEKLTKFENLVGRNSENVDGSH